MPLEKFKNDMKLQMDKQIRSAKITTSFCFLALVLNAVAAAASFFSGDDVWFIVHALLTASLAFCVFKSSETVTWLEFYKLFYD